VTAAGAPIAGQRPGERIRSLMAPRCRVRGRRCVRTCTCWDPEDARGPPPSGEGPRRCECEGAARRGSASRAPTVPPGPAGGSTRLPGPGVAGSAGGPGRCARSRRWIAHVMSLVLPSSSLWIQGRGRMDGWARRIARPLGQCSGAARRKPEEVQRGRKRGTAERGTGIVRRSEVRVERSLDSHAYSTYVRAGRAFVWSM
jgi:hypothetical protein